MAGLRTRKTSGPVPAGASQRTLQAGPRFWALRGNISELSGDENEASERLVSKLKIQEDPIFTKMLNSKSS